MKRLQILVSEYLVLIMMVILICCVATIAWQQNSINSLRNQLYDLDEAIDYNTSQLDNISIKLDDQAADLIDNEHIVRKHTIPKAASR